MSIPDEENSDPKYIFANSKKWMLLIPVLIFSGIVLGIGIVFRQKLMLQDNKVQQANKVQIEKSENTNLGLKESSQASISASNCLPGGSIIIEKVNLISPGFVVIHEIPNDYENGVFGNSDLLQAGESEAVTVLLSKETKENEKYYATLFSDDGDGSFSLDQGDKPMENKNGKSVTVKIIVESDIESDENYMTL